MSLDEEPGGVSPHSLEEDYYARLAANSQQAIANEARRGVFGFRVADLTPKTALAGSVAIKVKIANRLRHAGFHRDLAAIDGAHIFSPNYRHSRRYGSESRRQTPQ